MLQAVFPVVWVDEGATLDGENLDKLKAQLVSWTHIIYSTKIIDSFICTLYRVNHKNETSETTVLDL